VGCSKVDGGSGFQQFGRHLLVCRLCVACVVGLALVDILQSTQRTLRSTDAAGKQLLVLSFSFFWLDCLQACSVS
jgi:hypothetical protein